jgi:hypothetical protein
MNPNLKTLLEHLSTTLDEARRPEMDWDSYHSTLRLAQSNPRSLKSCSSNPK